MSTALKINKFLNDFFKSTLEDSDKELFDSVRKEFIRQQNHIELIASENIVSKAILYRSIHKKILKRFAAFQANITAYTFSVIVKIHGERINLGMIWGEQAVSSELLDYACNISDLVRDV